MKRLAAIMWMAMLAPACVWAQSGYPNKPVTIVVPFAAGGFSDNVARTWGRGVSEKWGVPVVIDNRTGAGGNIAGAVVVKAAPDGYTLFLANVATNAINPGIYKNQGFDGTEDFEPVILIAKTPNVATVNLDVPARSMKELVELARAQPGKLSFGTPGNASSGHMSGEMLKAIAGIRLEHVPYKGSPQVLTDLLNGNLQVAIDNIITWTPHVNGGRVRALAVTSAKRSPLLPNVPTMDESGFAGYEATSWFGIAAPKRTPREVIVKLNADSQPVIDAPEFRTRMTGAEIVGGSPESFRAYMVSERAKWGKIAKDINLSVD